MWRSLAYIIGFNDGDVVSHQNSYFYTDILDIERQQKLKNYSVGFNCLMI